jgi:TolB protein
MSCQGVTRRGSFPATILFTSVWLSAISLAAQTASHPAEEFQKNGKNFDSAYGAVSDASGLYMEAMYMPPVTTGPWSPAWSPDGRQIAFSMQGSLWGIPVTGGEAVQLTSDTGYDSEPAWSPDGSEIAFVRDNDRSIQIWVMKADGGSAHVVTHTGNANVDPRWSRDGKSILCTSSAGGKGFGLWVASIEDGRMRPVLEDQHQNITPSWSPDGKEIAFVSNRQWDEKEIVGTGGIWKLRLGEKDPSLLLQEETLWRARPAWSPDGQKIAYISFRGGNSQLWVLNAIAGNPLQLTFSKGEVFEPAWSPDGQKIAYISDEGGKLTLWTLPAVGGIASQVVVEGLKYSQPAGHLEVVVRDEDTGAVTPARVYLRANDGKSYAPVGAFGRFVTVTRDHYFHTTGNFKVDLPPGTATLEVMKGFEFHPQKQTVQIVAGHTQRVEFKLTRLTNMAAKGWYSGDNHVHMNYGGNYEATPSSLMLEEEGEDLNVVNDLLANWNSRIMDRQYFEGKLNGISHTNRLIYFNQEYRYSYPGHLNLVNLKNYVYPSDTVPATARQAHYPDLAQVLDEVHAQGGYGGLAHPFYGSGFLPRRSKEFPVLVALHKLDFFEVMCLWSDAYKSAEEWYRVLNLGFRLPASAGTDAMTNYSRAPSVGSVRVYVHADSPLTYEDWMHKLVAGHTFVTNGPLLTFEVNGKEPGDEIQLPSGKSSSVQIDAEAVSVFPMETLDILQNGKVVDSIRAQDPYRIVIHRSLTVSQSGWVAARVTGPGYQHLLMDTYVYAHTSPVYLTDANAPAISKEDAIHFRDWIDEVLPAIEQADCNKRGFLAPCFDTVAEKEQVLKIWRQARDVYQGLAGK